MNKKILLSISAIVAIVAVAAVATTAFFSDTQTATGNTFSAGTIEMAVDWVKDIPIHLQDMKPSQIGYTNFTVRNVGSDPINVTKEIKVTSSETVSTNRPECIAEGGVWSDNRCGNGDDETHRWTSKNDVDSVLQYDLSVKVYTATGTLAWNQTLHDMDKTVAELQEQKMFLGMIPSGYYMDVVESYHMKSEAGNEYQSDKITFDIVLTGEQLTGKLVLSNKNPNRPVKDGWFVLGTKTGTLNYGVKDSKFNYSFTGTAPLASTNYSLIMYEEPFSFPAASGWPRTVKILGAGTTDGSGIITLTDSLDTGDMLNAKIWLVKTTDLTGSTLGPSFSPADYLFETGMIDYYKS